MKSTTKKDQGRVGEAPTLGTKLGQGNAKKLSNRDSVIMHYFLKSKLM